MTRLVLAALGALAGTAVVVVAAARRGVAVTLRPRPAQASSRAERASRRRRSAVAAAAGLVTFLVTRWPMSAPLTSLAVLGAPGLGRSAGRATIANLEAIASFTEMLRDTLAGAAGLSQALIATAPIAPLPLRPALGRLAQRLRSGVALPAALANLAVDLDDAAADPVVACLLLAATERAQRLADLLGALATATREEVTMRLGIEASRASAQTAVRMITGFSVGLLGLMALLARAYLAPYRSLDGQLVLCLVGAIYGLGLWLMSIMVRPQAFSRLPLAAEEQA